jgi:transcriptional regulator with XRE-family HTH domain
VKIKITKPQDLGLLIRATRKQQQLRLDDVAGSAGVGPVFVREVERGKETVQFGRVIRLLQELGIELNADVADEVLIHFEKLQAEGLKPLPPKRRFSMSKGSV